MRKTLAAIACASALTVPAGNVWAATQAKMTQKKRVVTVKVNVTTTTVGSKKTKRFKITQVTYPVYPNHTDRSSYISEQALPLLRQEVLQLKGSSIQLVSGATDTSYAFVEALRGALTKAGA